MDLDQKPTIDRISDDNIAPTLEPGHGASQGKLVPPPLVAAMTPERRAEAEAKMRRKIDMRLMPMVILMYIMNCRFCSYVDCAVGGTLTMGFYF